jgi:flagellin
MPITFNTNLAALGAQRNIGISSNMASSSLAKLSSGSRIPTAKDDAAGLAIGSKLKSEVAGLTQASNNAAQAISMLQIADGALSSIGDVLQRMKTLAVQSSSGQLDDASRSLLNQEFTNLQSEIDRVANVTNFNGTELLNGGEVVATSSEVQAGYLNGKGVNISFDTDEAAAGVYRVDYDYTNAGTDTGNLTVTNMTTGESQTINIADLITAERAQPAAGDLTNNLTAGDTVDVNFDSLGVKLTLNSTFDVDADFGVAAGVSTALSTVQASVETNTTVARLDGGDLTAAQLAAITGFDAQTGNLSLSVDDDADNALVINAAAGLEFSTDGVTFATTQTLVVDGATANSVYVRATGASQAFARVDIAAAADVTGASGSATSTLVVTGLADGLTTMATSTSTAATFDFKVGTGTTTNDEISFTLDSATTTALGVNSSTINISTATASDTAITAINSAITAVASRRADVGAAQSRLDFAANSISVSIENTTAATSAIMDVDVSAEITNFTNKNVLMQAGISLLGQANQQPALLLRLLQ